MNKYLDENGLAKVADYVNSKEPLTFKGTSAEWNALTALEKAKYTIVCFTDVVAEGGAVVVDEVTDGNLNPVTSNAVYDAVKELADMILPDSMTHRFRGNVSSTGGGSYSAVCSVPPYIADNYNISGVNYADITGVVHLTSGISAGYWQNCTISVSLGSYGTSEYVNNNVIVEVTLTRKTS